MKQAPPPPEDNGPSIMTWQRLRQLLDAYGATPERWPAEERDAALAMLARSAEARAQRDKAARLDALLDLALAVPPSAELAKRILEMASTEDTPTASPRSRPRQLLRTEPRRPQPSAPRRNGAKEGSRPLRVWPALAAAASLAVAFWARWTLSPSPPELPSDVIATLGAYRTPTDVLLQWPGVDILNALPSVGCTDSELGCPELPVSPGAESRSRAAGRRYV